MSRDKQIAYRISKESVDKISPKRDIDILGYESPIQTIIGQMRTEYENGIYKAIQEQGVIVDKDELIKALQYDRNQYDKGYINGYNRKSSEVAREIFEEIGKILYKYDKVAEKDKSEYGELIVGDIGFAIAELKKKYTEEGK